METGGKRSNYYNSENDEEILIRTIPTWFIKISDRTKLKCMKELAKTQFIPPLDLNYTQSSREETDTPKIQKTPRTCQQQSLYFNVLESLSIYIYIL